MFLITIQKQCLLIVVQGITEEWKPTIFALFADLVFKDHVISNPERAFLKKMKDHLELDEQVANKTLDVLTIMYKGKI